jgi:hypothetical protein
MMTPAEQVLMSQRNRNYDELTQALIRIVELEVIAAKVADLEATIAKMKPE